MARKTIVFDFDGVILSYKSKWISEEIIPDEPVAGIVDSLKSFCEAHYYIVVCSARAKSEAGVNAIWNYLEKHGMKEYVKEVTHQKPPAIVYIDDRAITFDGHPETLLSKVENFKPWNKL